MTHELIEQKECKLTSTGNSKAVILPASWLEKLETKENTILVLRLCKGKKGTFVDLYKKQ